jgi:hypothetical protein
MLQKIGIRAYKGQIKHIFRYVYIPKDCPFIVWAIQAPISKINKKILRQFFYKGQNHEKH